MTCEISAALIKAPLMRCVVCNQWKKMFWDVSACDLSASSEGGADWSTSGRGRLFRVFIGCFCCQSRWSHAPRQPLRYLTVAKMLTLSVLVLASKSIKQWFKTKRKMLQNHTFVNFSCSGTETHKCWNLFIERAQLNGLVRFLHWQWIDKLTQLTVSFCRGELAQCEVTVTAACGFNFYVPT